MTAGARWFLPAIVTYAMLAYALLPESIDDAYITLRYARNLAQGWGPVFNPGEPVEGFSNPLWMAWLAVNGALGLSMPVMMKVGSVAAGFVVLVLVGLFARRLGGAMAVLTATLLLGASPFFVLWATDGLETMAYTCLVTGLFCACSQNRLPTLVGLLAALTALSRPEGAMFGVIACAYTGWTLGARSAAAVALPFLLAMAGYEGFRVWYFHEWVPNTALVKIHSFADSVWQGLDYLWGYSAHGAHFMIPGAVVGLFLLEESRLAWLAAGFISSQLLFILVAGGDFMYGYRFVTPVAPILALLVANMMGSLTKLRPTSMRVVLALGVAALVARSQLGALPPLTIRGDNITARRSVHFRVSDYLDERVRPNDVVVVSEAGIIPYGISGRVYDYLGLTSAYREVYGSAGRLDVRSIFDLKPKYIVLTYVEDGRGVVAPRLAQDWEISNGAEFVQRYREETRFLIAPEGDFLERLYYKYSPTASHIYFVVFGRSGV